MATPNPNRFRKFPSQQFKVRTEMPVQMQLVRARTHSIETSIERLRNMTSNDVVLDELTKMQLQCEGIIDITEQWNK